MSKAETIIRTVVCPLETSETKNEKLQQGVDEFRRAAKVTAEMLPSFQERDWQRNNSQIYRTVQNQLGESQIKDKVIQNAVHRVIENFKSTRELGDPVPKKGIPECDFVILTNQGCDIEPNERGYGFKAKFIPYKPEWWHLDIGDHQEEYLERALDGDARLGQAEVAYNDGEPVVRIAVTWEKDVTELDDAENVIGVDVGYRTLYAAAVRDVESGEVVDVAVEPGGEFQHHRNRLEGRKTRSQQSDKVGKVRQERERYTDHRLHEVASELVGLATDYKPCVIRLEDLTDYRKIEDDAIHDWPFNGLQDKIQEKALAEGIGVEIAEPYYTSQTCSVCGYRDSENRKGTRFECVSCGYQVNADVNAAMNIAE